MLSSHSRHLRHHLFHPARAFHHLAHLTKAPQQIVYLRDGAAAATRNALTTTPIQNVRTRPLLARHRKHDGLGALELLLVNREALDVTHAGQHAKNIFERPHLAHHFELRQKIVEVERSCAQLPLQAGGFLIIDCFSRFFDQTNYVAHSKNPPGQSVRYEEFELVELFTGAGKFDWPPRYFTH